MSPLGHIVERCEGSYTQPELHRGIKGKYQLPEMSCFYRPQLIYSWSEDASPETLPAMVQTAGLEPAHTSWCGALPTELRLHITTAHRFPYRVFVPVRPFPGPLARCAQYRRRIEGRKSDDWEIAWMTMSYHPLYIL